MFLLHRCRFLNLCIQSTNSLNCDKPAAFLTRYQKIHQKNFEFEMKCIHILYYAALNIAYHSNHKEYLYIFIPIMLTHKYFNDV